MLQNIKVSKIITNSNAFLKELYNFKRKDDKKLRKYGEKSIILLSEFYDLKLDDGKLINKKNVKELDEGQIKEFITICLEDIKLQQEGIPEEEADKISHENGIKEVEDDRTNKKQKED